MNNVEYFIAKKENRYADILFRLNGLTKLNYFTFMLRIKICVQKFFNYCILHI
jgi:hypothetical protein